MARLQHAEPLQTFDWLEASLLLQDGTAESAGHVAAGGSQSLGACFSHLLLVVCQPQVRRLNCTTLMMVSGSSLMHLCSQ